MLRRTVFSLLSSTFLAFSATSAFDRAVKLRRRFAGKDETEKDIRLRELREAEAASKYPSIANTVSVSVRKTSDSDKHWVIQLTDIDGQKVSLWCKSGEMDKPADVSFVSPY